MHLKHAVFNRATKHKKDFFLKFKQDTRNGLAEQQIETDKQIAHFI